MIKIYRLIGSNNIFSPLDTIFSNRGISTEDMKWYLNPTPYEYDSSLLGNIDKGMFLLLDHIEKGSHIHIQIDGDMDGAFSFTILMNYLIETFPNIKITWSNHTDKKKHGIEVELIPPETKLLIIPDASSNEYEIHKQLYDKGIDILIADHHEAPHYSEHATVINNQLDDYPNKWLSGTSIIYKLVQHIDKHLGLNNSKKYRDLNALGLIGDGMDLSSKETYWLVKDGLANIENELIKELVKENVDKGVELTPTVIAFKINPKINSLIRTGTSQEKDEFTMALLGHQEITINNRLRREDKSETWARRMTRTCNNTYSRQRKLRDQILSELEAKIEEEKLYENHFIIVEIEGEFNMNMSGYVAMFLVNRHLKPVIVLRKNEKGELVGSLRGYDLFMRNTKDFLNSLKLFNFAEGHQGACGVGISPDNRLLLDEKISEALSHVEKEEAYLVDFEMNVRSMSDSFIEEMDAYDYLWGRGIEKPMYAITDISVSASDIQLIGKAQNVLKFNKGNVEYVQFSADPELVKLKDEGMDLILTIIGQTSINSWLGNKTSQVVIESVQVVEAKEKEDLLGGFLF